MNLPDAETILALLASSNITGIESARGPLDEVRLRLHREDRWIEMALVGVFNVRRCRYIQQIESVSRALASTSDSPLAEPWLKQFILDWIGNLRMIDAHCDELQIVAFQELEIQMASARELHGSIIVLRDRQSCLAFERGDNLSLLLPSLPTVTDWYLVRGGGEEYL